MTRLPFPSRPPDGSNRNAGLISSRGALVRQSCGAAAGVEQAARRSARGMICLMKTVTPPVRPPVRISGAGGGGAGSAQARRREGGDRRLDRLVEPEELAHAHQVEHDLDLRLRVGEMEPAAPR